MPEPKIELTTLQQMKNDGRPISMMTAYDAPSARLVDAAGIDTILVGDSLSNVILGYPDTVPVTMDEMLHHVKAVTRVVQRAYVIADMPFMSYQVSREEALRNAGRFLKEGLARAVKMEGGGPVVETAAACVRAGIPVVGHLGLTPQSAQLLGGYRVQGREARAARVIWEDANALTAAGISLLVLECVPTELAGLIAKRITIPVIGIGAGPEVDGQVLVFHDALGFDPEFRPKFLKRFAEFGTIAREALQRYKEEVQTRRFPSSEQSFSMKDNEFALLEKELQNRSEPTDADRRPCP